jgi:ketosteroid isomerase-like protein
MLAPQEFINSFYQSIIDKNVESILSSYVQSDDTYVILEGPRLSTKGFLNIAPGWFDFCKSSISLDGIDWLEGPYIYTMTDSATLAGVIRLYGKVSDNLSFDNTFRASFVLKNTDHGYKILHEHVSGALSDPYGIGDWKKST